MSTQEQLNQMTAAYNNAIQKQQRLLDENKKLKEFFKSCMFDAFEGCHLDGWDIQDKALKLDLIYQDKYHQEKHKDIVNDPSLYEEGDCIFIIKPFESGLSE